MQCPICSVDLSELDLISRTEHVNICFEQGPSILTIGESGQVEITSAQQNAKAKRKICPVCSKTFLQLTSHLRQCLIKYDVPPELMLNLWNEAQTNLKRPKKFPRELLDIYIEKCIKEGRVGEQVEIARALSASMTVGTGTDASNSNDRLIYPPEEDRTTSPISPPEPVNAGQVQGVSNGTNSETTPISAGQAWLQEHGNGSSRARPNQPAQKSQQSICQSFKLPEPLATKKSAPQKPQTRLQIADESIKRANIALRVERELAATRLRRYEEALKEQGRSEALHIDRNEALAREDNFVNLDEHNQSDDDISKLNQIFFLARLKNCEGDKLCQTADCSGHELALILDEFQNFTGPAMDSHVREPYEGAAGFNPEPDPS